MRCSPGKGVKPSVSESMTQLFLPRRRFSMVATGKKLRGQTEGRGIQGEEEGVVRWRLTAVCYGGVRADEQASRVQSGRRGRTYFIDMMAAVYN